MRRLRYPGWQRDALAIAGVALITVGIAQIYTPAAWIFGGVFGLTSGILMELLRGRNTP